MTTSAPSVGELEHLLLLAVLQCQRDGTDAYTVPIRQQLVERTGRAIARGAVHTSLDRLETKGLVTSTMGEPVAIRGGRARRYYTVTPLGLDAIRHAQAAVQTLSAGLDTLLVDQLAVSRKSGSSRF
jgi:DNA-binding PadR family transcriptional regulator